MSEETIVCPRCGEVIALSRVLTHQIEQRLRAEFETQAGQREQAQREQWDRTLELERQKALARVKDEVEVERLSMKAEIDEKTRKLEESRVRELAMLKQTRELVEAKKTLDLEIERRVQATAAGIEALTVQRLAEEHRLRDAEKDKQLGDMRKQIEVLRRKAEQGSQQAQGESAEQDLEAVLRACFPQDELTPVPKGVRGADVLQHVLDPIGGLCGTIVWEAKNTKAWSPGWLAKLRDDQRELKGDIAVLATTVLPADVRHFGVVEGVWVTDFTAVRGLASALRMQLVQIALARASAVGRETKMDRLYAYLTGSEFRHRIEAAVEAFIGLKDDLDRERRALESSWAKREKQIERAMSGLSGMYGDMQGIVGANLPRVSQLELDSPEALIEADKRDEASDR